MRNFPDLSLLAGYLMRRRVRIGLPPPDSFDYDPLAKEIRVGEGRFGPVASDVWEFEVSGLRVVQSWLAYRMKVRAGKRSSPLDDIRPDRWTPRMTDEFLELYGFSNTLLAWSLILLAH